jgi:broad specificity phosphatase PhoE
MAAGVDGYVDFYFVRHLEPQTPEGGKALCGGTPPGSKFDTGLTLESQEKAIRIADEVLKRAALPVAAVYSSPYNRTKETVAPLAQRLHCPLQESPLLNELDHGKLAGLLSGVWQKHPSWLDYKSKSRLEKLAAPQAQGAETNCQIIDRVRAFVASVAPQYLGKSVVCGTHDGTMRAFLNRFELEKHLQRPVGANSAEAVAELKQRSPVPQIQDADHFANGAIYHVRYYPAQDKIEQVGAKIEPFPKPAK